jgi:hypothetical protein
MAWLAQNWFWVLLFVLFIGMHLFGHGGHGGHGGGSGGCGHKRSKQKDQNKTDKDSSSTGHQH